MVEAFKQPYWKLAKHMVHEVSRLHIGFREGHTTEYATYELFDRITLEMDYLNTQISIFLNFSKAFDILDHQILIKRLEYYALNGMSVKFMENYLSNRKIYVEIDDLESDMLDFTTVILQGSILGPLLLIIYMNDLALTYIQNV